MIQIKRVYDPPTEEDGYRVLVDRLWPRGVRREEAEVDRWMKEVAPSDELRQWYGHDPGRWKEFKRRYREELEEKPEAVGFLAKKAREGTLTLICAARDTARNNAEALKERLDEVGAEE